MTDVRALPEDKLRGPLETRYRNPRKHAGAIRKHVPGTQKRAASTTQTCCEYPSNMLRVPSKYAVGTYFESRKGFGPLAIKKGSPKPFMVAKIVGKLQNYTRKSKKQHFSTKLGSPLAQIRCLATRSRSRFPEEGSKLMYDT